MPKQNLPTSKTATTNTGANVATTATTSNSAAGQWQRNRQYQRAIEAVIWGMPAVNLDLMFQEMVKLGGTWNQVVYWSRLFDWKNQTLTPNPDVIYLMPFLNTKDGPMVIEIPPADEGSFTGSIMDAWQVPLEDVGPTGADKGKGAKFLVLPPGYKENIPGGFTALPSSTYTGYVLLRSNPRSGSKEDVAQAAAYGRRIKVYPLSQQNNIPETKFVDAIDAVYDSSIRYDIRFFESLDRVIQRDPWLERDKVMIDALKTIGIEKGKSFHPDAGTKEILKKAAIEAHSSLDASYPTFFEQTFYSGTHWCFPVPTNLSEGIQSAYTGADSYPVDARGVLFSFIYFSPKHLGAGQFYLMTIYDKDGRPFDGKATYRLSVPAKVPVNLYWSVTIYNRDTHTLIHDKPYSSRSSITPELTKNADGSVDIYFGPETPMEDKMKSNWIPTSPNGQFEVLFRFYGPEKPLYDKTWTMPDIENIS